MSGTPDPAAPGSAPVLLSQADLAQLIEQAAKNTVADVRAGPSAVVTAFKKGVMDVKTHLPQIIVALMAAAGLALHFVKLPL